MPWLFYKKVKKVRSVFSLAATEVLKNNIGGMNKKRVGQ
jgi:hypothetical protein